MNAALARISMFMVAALMIVCGRVAAGEAPRPAHDLGTALDAIPAGFDIWYAVDGRVVHALVETDRRIAEASLKEKPPSLPVLLARFDLYVRGGHRAKARKVLTTLYEWEDFRKGEAPPEVADFLIEREEWDLAAALARSCPLRRVGRGHALVGHLAKTQGDAAADQLLERQASAGSEEWMRAWISFRAARGGADSILRQLEGAVREEPASLAAARAYLLGVRAEGKSRGVGWMGKVCRPKLAYESYLLGREITWARAFPAAVSLLKRSLSTEITKTDRDRASMTMQMMPLGATMDQLIRSWTEQALVEAYRGMGRADLAQPHVEKLARTEIHGRGLTPWNARLAGQAQAESGGRAVEAMVREQEKTKANSPEYWLARANYYWGRKQDSEARQAFQKALDLCSIVASEGPSKIGPLRWRVLSAYVQYLRSQKQMAEAVELLRSELRQTGHNSETRQRALSALVHIAWDGGPPIRFDDELLWTVLAANPRWDHAEEGCLSRMLKKAAPAERERVVERAGSLCQHADPSRAKVVGWLCTRYDASDRAVPLLQDAVARLEDDRERRSANFALFEAYLNLGQVGEAERQFPAAMEQLTAREIPEWLARLAAVAAEAGDLPRAMAVWKRVANIDATLLGSLRALADNGLREDLRQFYTEWQQADPESWVPAAALRRMENAR